MPVSPYMQVSDLEFRYRDCEILGSDQQAPSD